MEPKHRLLPLIRSDHWHLLVSVLEERKVACILRLLTCEVDEMKKLQGSVQELDILLNLKASLTAEGKSRVASQPLKRN